MAGEKLTLTVDGMTCGHCVGRVQKALEKSPGVLSATVDLSAGSAEVQVQPGTAAADLVAAVEKAGYPARTA
jgi:Cu+-exporting ATPase